MRGFILGGIGLYYLYKGVFARNTGELMLSGALLSLIWIALAN